MDQTHTATTNQTKTKTQTTTKTQTATTNLAIKDFPINGIVSGKYLLLDSRLKTDKNGKPYINGVIGDNTGKISLKIWGAGQEFQEQISPGCVIEIQNAQVREFNGFLQIELDAARKNTYHIYRADSEEVIALLPVTPYDRDELWQQIEAAVDSVTALHYKELLRSIFGNEKTGQLFRNIPAGARKHHAYIGGLMEHTARVAALCIKMAQVYPEVDSSLLITGALLHDIGKIETYNLSRGFDMTDDGRFFGHLVIGVRIVEQEITRMRNSEGLTFPEQAAHKLLHLLLSHHGTLEWGSPVEPLLLEACILHHADNLDAQAMRFSAARRDAVGKDWVYDETLARTIFVGDDGAQK